MKTTLFLALFSVQVTAASPKVLDALAMIETGANTTQRCKADLKVGKHGEVSRYQIKPKEWLRVVGSFFDPTEPKNSNRAANIILTERVNAFLTIKNRPPTAQEIYLLWNAPAYALGVEKVPKQIRERCKRFANLLEK